MIKFKPYQQQLILGLLLACCCLLIYFVSQRPKSSVKNEGVELLVEYEVLNELIASPTSSLKLNDIGSLCSRAIAKINEVSDDQYRFKSSVYEATEHLGSCLFAQADNNKGAFIAKIKLPDTIQFEASN